MCYKLIIRKRNIALGLLVLLVMPLLSQAQFGRTDLNKQREEFPKYVKDNYYTNLEYKLDKPLDKLPNASSESEKTMREEYEELMDCIFYRADYEMKKHFNDIQKKRAQELESEWKRKTPEEPEKCEKLSKYHEVQHKNKFTTKCSLAGQGTLDPIINEDFSTCRVNELVMNELAAYKEWLIFKADDGKSFEKELKERLKEEGAGGGEGENSPPALNVFQDRVLREQWDQVYIEESRLAEAAVMESLARYTEQFQSYIRVIDVELKTLWAAKFTEKVTLMNAWYKDAIKRLHNFTTIFPGQK